jgi:hypothetical protein
MAGDAPAELGAELDVAALTALTSAAVVSGRFGSELAIGRLGIQNEQEALQK